MWNPHSVHVANAHRTTPFSIATSPLPSLLFVLIQEVIFIQEGLVWERGCRFISIYLHGKEEEIRGHTPR